MTYHFRKATTSEIPHIWIILQQAIARRKADGSDQWQDGYPNPDVIQNDIDKNAGFVLTEDDTIIGYTAVLINDEPAYENIKGNWLTHGDFVVFHRVAISENHLGKGLAKKLMNFIEEFAINNNIYSVKADTNFDNFAMMAIFEKSGYSYCGEVHFRGSARKAYEKVIVKN
ncbi:GNAT family N-acetyltransferase [Flavobacterium frigoris]|uniref:Ribosomal protein S18 acetylase RimI n=1 Tax=Flavobacterium frigoris TaxID=229204 RepID=A0A1H9P0G1_FLAFI|nr:GNAT family N-acetyltransferase [Flavobacterium frigoris]SER41754.1 Ribosomal protein S18 acetylase RimI [Flavobacterium frigoris]